MPSYSNAQVIQWKGVFRVAVEKTTEASSVRSLDRGLLILDALIANPVQSLSQISSAVEIPKSTTHRLLMTLQFRGYVNAVAGETGLYQVGVKGMWYTSARKRIHQSSFLNSR